MTTESEITATEPRSVRGAQSRVGTTEAVHLQSDGWWHEAFAVVSEGSELTIEQRDQTILLSPEQTEALRNWLDRALPPLTASLPATRSGFEETTLSGDDCRE